MRAWWNAKPLEERRALIARRDPERIAATERRRSRTQQKQQSVLRSQARHPDRHAARQAVHRAVRRGDLVRLPCFCGNGRSEAHHPDYAKPLEIEWLCRSHHTLKHFEVHQDHDGRPASHPDGAAPVTRSRFTLDEIEAARREAGG